MALPTLRILGFIIGIFLITLAASMLVPILTMLAFDRTEGIQAFIWSSVATFVTGLGLVLPGRPEHVHLRPLRESEINQKGKARKLWDIEEGKGI